MENWEKIHSRLYGYSGTSPFHSQIIEKMPVSRKANSKKEKKYRPRGLVLFSLLCKINALCCFLFLIIKVMPAQYK